MKKRLHWQRLIDVYGPVVDQLSVLPPNKSARRDEVGFANRPTAGSSQTLLIASAEPFEGRTTTAAGMALAAARLKPSKRILLIDLDLRHPGLHKLFLRKNGPGLREILADESKLEQVAIAQQVDNLHLVTAGETEVDLPEVFRASAFEKVLGQARSEFDLVLFDSPPVNRYPDAKLIGEQADATMLVVRSRRTRPEQVMEAKQELGNSIAGVFLNDYRNPIPTPLQKYI